MKKILWTVLVSGVLALIMALSVPNKVSYVKPAEALAEEEIVEIKVELNYQQKAWLGALQWCESRGNPKAINPNDRDNTPSYGILQFKPSTFNYYQARYGTDKGTGYMDPDAQTAIVEQMIIRNDVKWSQQFPECVRKLGKPPVIPTAKVDKK